jgi:hypothetical protein
MHDSNNPYRYQGPLDPVEDSLACAPRDEYVSFIIEKISRGEHVAIQGPRQIGKTTLLFLVRENHSLVNYVYINFEVAPVAVEKDFYQWLIRQILKKIPHRKSKYKTVAGKYPDLSFLDFLNHFKPKGKKVILLLDEIDRLGLDSLKGFLHVWRSHYHECFALKKTLSYTVITTSSLDLLKIPRDPTSPFNITNTLNLKDLSPQESESLIDEPFKELNIAITPDAKKILLAKISGHPQLLQQACYLLVEKAKEKETRLADEKDVDDVFKRLMGESSVLNTLKKDLWFNEGLKKLVNDILLEKTRLLFHPYSDYALMGAGAIKEDEDSNCRIRNAIFEQFISDILKNPPEDHLRVREEKPERLETPDIRKNTTQAAPNTGPKTNNRKKSIKWIKIPIFLSGIVSLGLFLTSLISRNTELMTMAGIFAALCLGLLIVFFSGESDDN